MIPRGRAIVMGMSSSLFRRLFALIVVVALSAPTLAQTRPADLQIPPRVINASEDYLLHLPGIGGFRRIDRALLGGLQDGGLRLEFDDYDWTGENPGLIALTNYARNHEQAQIVCDKITARFRVHPAGQIFLTSHSGGAGIAAWALEKLPADVYVQDVLMLAPALSPGYDLTHALAHIRGKLYVFFSPNDVIILSTGTRLFGTIDGIKSDAAGFAGFTRPNT